MRSLWAVPVAEDVATFQQQIDRLAADADGPRFAPHVTLLGSVPGDPDRFTDAVSANCAFELEFVALADSEERFKCVTLTAAPAPPLLDLRRRLADVVGADASPYEPHLSLVYGELTASRRSELRASVSLSLPLRTTIDAVWLVDTSPDDAEQWRVEHRWVLRASG